MGTIGQNLGFTGKKVYTGASTTAVTLDWDDENVQLFEGTGNKDVFLPAGDMNNAYGEIWISNGQGQDVISVKTNTTATGSVQNLHGNTDCAIADGETAHFFYVPFLRNYNPNTGLSDTKVRGAKRGAWVGGVLGNT